MSNGVHAERARFVVRVFGSALWSSGLLRAILWVLWKIRASACCVFSAHSLLLALLLPDCSLSISDELPEFYDIVSSEFLLYLATLTYGTGHHALNG